MTKQLTLKLDLHQDARFSNFCVGNNQSLVNVLQDTARGRGQQFVYLWGQPGVGKTHLLQACCHVANHLKLSPIYLPLQQVDALKPDILENLEALQLVCVDNVEAIAGRPAWEEAFFYFYNRMHEAGKRLIVAGAVPPSELGMALPDLVSRLAWGTVFQIQELTDEEKRYALLIQAESRGLSIPDNVAHYIFTHWQRNMVDLFAVLDKLDQASLQAKHKLTLPFVKKVLAK